MIYPAFLPKVERISSTTSGSAHPTIRPAPPDVAFTEFASLLSHNVATAIARLPDKSPAADPSFHVSLFKSASDLHHSWRIFNRSLATGRVPASFKDSFVTPAASRTLKLLTISFFHVSLQQARILQPQTT